VIPEFAKFMRLFGIKDLYSVVEHIGPTSYSNVRYTPYATLTIPETIQVTVPAMVRWLGEGMNRFGIVAIETDPTPEELTVIADNWQRASVASTEKLPPSVDPSDQLVFN
jgi:hypothetical protein